MVVTAADVPVAGFPSIRTDHGVLTTSFCGNDVGLVHASKEASNPVANEEGEEGGDGIVSPPSASSCTQNPPRASVRRIVYRVTSLPLDAYAVAMKSHMEIQDSGCRPAPKHATDATSSWWGCCFSEWSFII